MADWPTSLPDEIIQAGYSQSAPDVVQRSQMDAGPAKTRRRFTAGVSPFTARGMLTAAQLVTLRTFHDTTLQGGAIRFSWDDPITADSVELRFTSPIGWSARGPDLFEVSMDLEVLP